MDKRAIIGLINVFIVITIFLLFLNSYFRYSGETKRIYIKRGQSINEIAKYLEKEGVVPNEKLFELYFTIKGGVPKAGEYEIKNGESLNDIWEKLTQGKEILYKFTIYPGNTLWDIGENLEKQGFIENKEDFYKYVFNSSNVKKYGLKGSSFEGYFPPDTYNLSKFQGKDDIEYFIGAFLRIFKKRYEKPYKGQVKEKFSSKNSDIKLDFYDVMIIASLVEAEASSLPNKSSNKEKKAKFEEKRKIAGVIINRLKKGQRLEVDPTVKYALRKNGIFNKNFDKNFDSPFNTYKYAGLPPTPICSFTVESLEAVINYKNHNYYYYRSLDKKTHVFSKTYEEHKRKAIEYNLKQKGKN